MPEKWEYFRHTSIAEVCWKIFLRSPRTFNRMLLLTGGRLTSPGGALRICSIFLLFAFLSWAVLWYIYFLDYRKLTKISWWRALNDIKCIELCAPWTFHQDSALFFWFSHLFMRKNYLSSLQICTYSVGFDAIYSAYY